MKQSYEQCVLYSGHGACYVADYAISPVALHTPCSFSWLTTQSVYCHRYNVTAKNKESVCSAQPEAGGRSCE